MVDTPQASLDDDLLGRDRERTVIEDLLAAARRGQGGALVIRGEAGIGKTALLKVARRARESMTVLHVTGIEAESELAFAGLYGLLRPALTQIRELPPRQAAALEGALGLAAATESDRFLVSVATLGVIAAVAEREPLVCVVDDVQWLDKPSADALLFAARRLDAEPAAIVLAARDAGGERFRAEGVPELVVTGLPDEIAATVLERRVPGAAPSVRSRLLAEAEGNPLALIELPAALSEEQLAGTAPLPEAIPLTPRLAAVFRQQIQQLTAETRQALLVAAIDGSGEPPVVIRALHTLAINPDALDAAERAGIVQSDSGRIEFRHPLVRAAVLDSAALGEQRHVHSVLAAVLSGDQHVDRRVWHQAMAAIDGDEEVAAALEASGRRAQLRAGHASAATAYERAAQLTVDDHRRGTRMAAAAEAAWDAGQPERALALIASGLPHAEPALRARLLYLRGCIEARCGSIGDAVTTLLEGAKDTDAELALAMLHEAAEVVGATGNLEAVREIGERASDLTTQDVRSEFSRRVLMGAGALVAGELEDARRTLDDAITLATELDDDPRAQIWAANASAGDSGVGMRYTAKAVEIARRKALFSLLPLALEHHAKELLRTGRLDLAYAAAQEGYGLALELGHGTGWHLATMAHVEAIRGDEQAARDHAEQALSNAQRSGDIFLKAGVQAAIGLLELTLGRPAESADMLLMIVAPERKDLAFVATVGPAANAIEAIVRAGRPNDDAEPALVLLRDWATHAPADANRAIVARAEALLERREPEGAFREAARLAAALPPFEQGRTELLYGEWLRRARRRSDSRVHLRRAAELFRSVGADPWAERAEGELRASGETARKRDPSTRAQLTPQELQITTLAATGLTNLEIASQLFVSPRTVEYHLRKVFVKLGVSSRTELIRRGEAAA